MCADDSCQKLEVPLVSRLEGLVLVCCSKIETTHSAQVSCFRFLVMISLIDKEPARLSVMHGLGVSHVW